MQEIYERLCQHVETRFESAAGAAGENQAGTTIVDLIQLMVSDEILKPAAIAYASGGKTLDRTPMPGTYAGSGMKCALVCRLC
jgi:hypothetical protein